MNQLKSCVICVLLTICFMNSKAQQVPSFREPDYNKPKLFADLPEKSSNKTAEAEGLLLNTGTWAKICVEVSISSASSTFLKMVFMIGIGLVGFANRVGIGLKTGFIR